MSILDKFSPKKRNSVTLKERSKKPTIRKDEALIMIDNREVAHIPELTSYLIKNFGRKNYLIDQLEFGDYQIISKDGQFEFAIEFKKMKKWINSDGELETYNDLIESIKDNRVNYQLPEIAENFDDSLLVVQTDDHLNFDYYSSMTHWNEYSVIRSWVSLVLRKSTSGARPPVLVVRTIEDLAVVLDKVATMIEDDDFIRTSKIGRKKITKQTTISDPYVFRNTLLNMFAQIPLIGPSRAKDLLNEFDWSFEKIYNASLNDLRKALGKVTGTRIYDLLHTGNFTL